MIVRSVERLTRTNVLKIVYLISSRRRGTEQNDSTQDKISKVKEIAKKKQGGSEQGRDGGSQDSDWTGSKVSVE